jgi:hypothetical protein
MKDPYMTIKDWVLEGWSVDIGNSVRYELADLLRRAGLSRLDQVKGLLDRMRSEGLLTLAYVDNGVVAMVKLTALGETEGRKMPRRGFGFNPA